MSSRRYPPEIQAARVWLKERQALFVKLSNNITLLRSIENTARVIAYALAQEKKILIFGNGGSAAEAQHFAAELVCRFIRTRKALAAIALTTDTSIITAQANDSGFHSIFARQITALAQEGDIVVGLTTSDADLQHSANILTGFRTAKSAGALTVGLFSQKTKNLLRLTDHAICIPADNTALIQEAHLTVIHFLCDSIEGSLFNE